MSDGDRQVESGGGARRFFDVPRAEVSPQRELRAEDRTSEATADELKE